MFRDFFFFFLSPLASKVLICIRLSRVMTFNVINVTSIMPLHLSCLHLQNVNVSGYMAVTRDPEEREEVSGLGSCGETSLPARLSFTARELEVPSLRVRRVTHTCVRAQEHTHTHRGVFIPEIQCNSANLQMTLSEGIVSGLEKGS